VRHSRGKVPPDVCLGLCLFLESGRRGELLSSPFGIRRVLGDAVFMYDLPNPSLHDESGDLEALKARYSS